MPLGRSKQYLRGLAGVAGRAFALVAPARIIPPAPQMAWLLNRPSALPGADQVIEQCGDASTRGWRLTYLTTGAFRFTVYTAGPTATSVTTPENVATDALNLNRFFVVRASWINNVLAIALNNHAPTQAAGVMTAPAATDSRVLLAADTVGTSVLTGLLAFQATLGVTINPAVDEVGLLSTTQLAQRLVEFAECCSYVDFGRFAAFGTASVTQGHFGDDATGGRVTLTGSGSVPILRQVRSDRLLDWSTT